MKDDYPWDYCSTLFYAGVPWSPFQPPHQIGLFYKSDVEPFLAPTPFTYPPPNNCLCQKRKPESQFYSAVSAWDAINSVTLFPFFTSIVQSFQVLFLYFAVAGEYTWYWYALFLHDPNSSKQPDRFSFIIKAFLQLLNLPWSNTKTAHWFSFLYFVLIIVFFNMNLPRLDNNSQLFPLLDGEQGQGDQQRAVQGHLVKVVQGCSRLFTSSSSSRSPGWIIVCQ